MGTGVGGGIVIDKVLISGETESRVNGDTIRCHGTRRTSGVDPNAIVERMAALRCSSLAPAYPVDIMP